MAGQRIPGPIGTDPGPMTRLDSGTSARMATPAPGGVCAMPENGLHGPAYTLDLHDLGWVDTLQAARTLWSALEQSRDHVGRIVQQETDVVVDGILKGILPAIGMAIGTLAASAALGAAVGGALGALAGGVGAVPGAVAGGQAGVLLGTAVLEWLGLGFLVVHISCALGQIHDYAGRATRRAVNSLFVPSHQRSAEITLAAVDYARAQAELIKAVLMGLVALLLKNAAVTSSRKAGLPELLGNLRKSRLGEGFAGWIERNWSELVVNPKLLRQTSRATAPPSPTQALTPSQLRKNLSEAAPPSPPAPMPTPTRPATSVRQPTPSELQRQTVIGNIKRSAAARRASQFEQLPRYETAYDFYTRQAGFSAERAQGHLAGIDFRQPVSVVELQPGTNYVQHVVNKQVGNYFAPPGTPAEMLGINPAGRTPRPFKPAQSVTALRSTAATITDTWTIRTQPFKARGGGTQFFVPDKGTMIPAD